MRAKTHYVYIGNIASYVSVNHLCQVFEHQTSHYRQSNHHPVPGFGKGKRFRYNSKCYGKSESFCYDSWPTAQNLQGTTWVDGKIQ